MPHILIASPPISHVPTAGIERVTLAPPQSNSASNFVIGEVPGLENLLSLALPSFPLPPALL